MEPIRRLGEPQAAFNARLVRVTGRDADFFTHSSDAILAERTRRRCASDDCDDISISFMLEGESESTRNTAERRVDKGDVYLIDYGQPVQMRRSQHLDASLIMPRRRAIDAIGGDPAKLAGLKLPRRGLTALLANQVQSFNRELHHLTDEHRALAISVTMEMALAVLQQLKHGASDADQFGRGVYELAQRVIARDCADPELTPAMVAVAVGCSRSTLYRLFSAHGRSVGAAIWAARLALAATMLADPERAHLSIGEIAFRSGFLDQPSFGRMFRRRYGMAPRDARHATTPR